MRRSFNQYYPPLALGALVATPSHLDCLALEALAAILAPRPLPRWAITSVFASTFAALAIMSLRWTSNVDSMNLPFSSTLSGVCFGSLLLLLVRGNWPSLLRRAFGWRPLQSLGKYSYGIYVYHWLLFPLVNEGFSRCLGAQNWENSCAPCFSPSHSSTDWPRSVGTHLNRASSS